MTKQELIKNIEMHFGSVTKFFKYLGYKYPEQSKYSFIKNNKIPLAMVKFIEIYGELQRLRNLL